MELLDGEEIIWTGHPVWRSTILVFLRSALLACVPLIIGVIASATGNEFLIPLYQWVLISVVLVAAVVVWDVLKRLATVYTISSRRLHIRRGILSRAEQSTRIERVQNVNTAQSLLGRILGVGDVDFDTAGGDGVDADFRFNGVNDPHGLVARIERFRQQHEGEATVRRGGGL